MHLSNKWNVHDLKKWQCHHLLFCNFAIVSFPAFLNKTDHFFGWQILKNCANHSFQKFNKIYHAYLDKDSHLSSENNQLRISLQLDLTDYRLIYTRCPRKIGTLGNLSVRATCWNAPKNYRWMLSKVTSFQNSK